MDINIDNLDFLRKILKQDLRLDNRNLLEYRKINKIDNYTINAEGSCYLELGNTKVLSGVKLEISEPYEDKEGIFINNVEFSQVSDSNVDPASEEVIEFSRVVDRVIRESGFIDTKKLVIDDKNVWTIYLDTYVLNNDGNIIDAAVLSSILALRNTRFPKLEKENDKYIINYKEKTDKRLPLNENKIPIMVTFAKIDNKFILDPNKYEEEAADFIIHIGLTDNINALQTRKSGSISLEEFDYLLNKAKDFKEYLIRKYYE
ncbi:exosome complex component Rrp42 [Nanobdella aerobiophila]|uniref:Exosome complex component Rrp42 n=1 Tax=Nanobdella aerobiophila TaxID=2586965 RepID=A0A915SSE7_9ARCH|nr:exosome complex component Rrp42 [Nanobdella aerobiophila]BBL45336.1 exosome complex component Rrp42 [Nanobdella aerobiophila]